MKKLKFTPSSSDRWMSCPASVKLIADIPKPDTTIYAKNGTACHNVADVCLKKNKSPHDFIEKKIEVWATPKNDYIPFEKSMAETVQTYLDELALLRKEYPKAKYTSEKKLSITPVPRLKINGVVDYNIKQRFGDIVVVDLKAGVGVTVDPSESTQTWLYAIMAINNQWDEYDKARMIIVQPNEKYGDTRKEHTMPVSDLKQWYYDECIPAIKLALGDNAPFGPSEKVCRWCPALPTCKAAAGHVLSAAGQPIEFDPRQPQEFTNAEIGQILPIIDLYKKWSSAVTAYAIDELRQGRPIDGYKLVRGRANRVWIDEEAVQKLLKRLKVKVSDMFTKKFKSPAACEKLLPSDKREKLKPFIDKPEGKLQLAKESSKKPAVSIEPAAEFNDDFDFFE